MTVAPLQQLDYNRYSNARCNPVISALPAFFYFAIPNWFFKKFSISYYIEDLSFRDVSFDHPHLSMLSKEKSARNARRETANFGIYINFS